MSWTGRLKKDGIRHSVDVREDLNYRINHTVLKWIRQVKCMSEARMIKRKYESNVKVVGRPCMG